MNNTPLITVVTVCYNAVNELEKTMLSVLNQTYDNIEYIVIDGGSKDGTVDIIKKYADRLAYWVSEPDKGIYDAMNKGIHAAKGEYLIFMNGGDSFKSDKALFFSIPYLEKNFDVVSGIAFISNQIWIPAKNSDLSLTFFIKKSLCHQSTFVKRVLFDNCLYDDKLKIASDTLFFFQSLILKNASYLDIPVEIALCDDPGASGQQSNAFLERITALKKNLPERMSYDIDFIIDCHNPATMFVGRLISKYCIIIKIHKYIKSKYKHRQLLNL